MSTTTFNWEKLYALQEEGKIDRALDLIFETCYSFDVEPDLQSIDAILTAVDLNRLGEDLVVGFLSAVYSLSDQLSSYQPFLTKVRAWLETRKDRDIDALLKGFEGPPEGRLIFTKQADKLAFEQRK
jgi:hypothetical protein